MGFKVLVYVQSIAPTKIHAEIICSLVCRFAWFRGHSCMRMVIEKPDKGRRQVYEYLASAKAFCRLSPKCKAYMYTRNDFKSCGVSLRFSSAIFSEWGQWNYLNYSRQANNLTWQPIRTTTRFSGSDITGQFYRQVLSDASLLRLSERRRRLKFRLGK